MAVGGDLRFDIVLAEWSWIAKGLAMTLAITALSMLLAIPTGLLVALMSLSRLRVIRWAATVYVQVFRGVPLLVFIIWMYYGVSMAVGVNFSPVTAGVLCFALQYGSWLSEVFRGGIQAVGRGQREAAASLGLTAVQTFVYVVLPQATRIVLPSIGNLMVGLLKDSSLVSIIGVFELMRQAQTAVSLTFRPFEFYTVTAGIYIVLTFLLARGIATLERRLQIPGTA
jgi:His/Glu/Gln/Arg/opine family amino acid ABC transporter permease subunit